MLTIREISDLLFNVWDPLAVKGNFDAPNEYDDFAEEMLPVLESGAGEVVVETTLEGFLIEMGLPKSWLGDTNHETARALVTLRNVKLGTT